MKSGISQSVRHLASTQTMRGSIPLSRSNCGVRTEASTLACHVRNTGSSPVLRSKFDEVLARLDRKRWEEIAWCNGSVYFRHCVKSVTVTFEEPAEWKCTCGAELKVDRVNSRTFAIYELI